MTVIYEQGDKDDNLQARVAGVRQYAPEEIAPVQPQEDRRRVVTGDITRKEIKLTGKPHDINRLRDACDRALKAAAERGNFEETYLIHVDPPQEDER